MSLIEISTVMFLNNYWINICREASSGVAKQLPNHQNNLLMILHPYCTIVLISRLKASSVLAYYLKQPDILNPYIDSINLSEFCIYNIACHMTSLPVVWSTTNNSCVFLKPFITITKALYAHILSNPDCLSKSVKIYQHQALEFTYQLHISCLNPISTCKD